MNHFDQVRLFEVGLADKSTTAPLYKHPHGTSSFSLGKISEDAEASSAITLRRLDDVLAEQGVETVHCLKMDVEGAEELILQGAVKFFEKCKPRVIFEINPPAIEALQLETFGAWHFLEARGYQFYTMDPTGIMTELKSRPPGANVIALPKNIARTSASFHAFRSPKTYSRNFSFGRRRHVPNRSNTPSSLNGAGNGISGILSRPALSREKSTNAQRENFRCIVTISSDPVLYESAKQRFKNDPHVHVLQGDSGFMLGEALRLVNGPTLFWLDAHYSGGATAKADLETPILKELSIIASRGSYGDVILIDDARLFGWRSDYPRLSKIKQFVNKHWPDYKVEVESDLIRIMPRSPALFSTQSLRPVRLWLRSELNSILPNEQKLTSPRHPDE